MIKLLSGNEALALGAYHAGVNVAAAYPGTPSTEILESLAHYDDVYAEWSTNEQAAMEVALGAAYAGVRAMVSLKQVGLNVASDAFMAAATTGVNAGMVVICADDPGIHSSQNEQDSRHYVNLAKVPMLEPSDSQEAYEFMAYAFDISERFDTPVLVRTTTRISHSKSVVNATRIRAIANRAVFQHNVAKYVMLPVYARLRHQLIEERLVKLADYAETFPANQILEGEHNLGVVTSGVSYQYAREVLPQASFLKLGMTYPLPMNLLRNFAARVDKLIVIEELDPFLQENIQSMGIKISGKEFIPRTGELNPDIIEQSGHNASWLPEAPSQGKINTTTEVAKRPPLLCPGCPHSGIFFVLSSIGQRSKLSGSKGKTPEESKLIITGDIGCYTLGAYPPLLALDTTACMGASIGLALGMEKAGVDSKVVAVIGDSTFMHAGITGLVNAVYNSGRITLIILDNGTTAMTGHQDHPGTGISAQGKKTAKVELESLVRGIGVNNVSVVDAFNLKALRASVRSSLDSNELSVIIVRGSCSMMVPKRSGPRVIDDEKCNQCDVCLLIGCPAIQSDGEQITIDTALCAGDICTICEQLCPRQAISRQPEVAAKELA
ncbi:MAG: indolepyruvate ferredoxin oxidoreductase subunit alpha [Chloroflexi bacterium]|nr:indolepyruvate ferredoxin oxidoreductase subunit alpha [Chloroflexota bacterium]